MTVAQLTTMPARGQIGSKLRSVGLREAYPDGGIGHYCPGCGIMHVFSIDRPDKHGRRWQWDGDVEQPTFLPDMDVWPPSTVKMPTYFVATRCHYSIVAGVIEFFVDCTHRLRGQRVPLPALPGFLRD